MTTLLEPIELRARGFDALVQSLGWVNAVRFIQQYESLTGDYTAERDALLAKWTVQDVLQLIKSAQ